MVVSPFGLWFRGLLAVLVFAAAGYLLVRWHDTLPAFEPTGRLTPDGEPERRPLSTPERVAAWRPGWDRPTALFAGGLALLLWSGLGRAVTPKLWLRKSADDPRHDRPPARTEQVRCPDGTELHVEVSGQPAGPPVVLTHGWGADAAQWQQLRAALEPIHRVIAWDLPGLGRSAAPPDRDYRLEHLANHLRAVLELAGGRPAVLVGHSIGGMIQLTLARLHPDALGPRVAGLVLVHTTPTNPARTKAPTWLVPFLQKPVLEPLCWLTIALSPVAWVLAWLGYLNGSAHWSNHRSAFAGTETAGQLEFVTRYGVRASPAVLARGVLGMFRYDATAALAAIRVPVLVVAADRDTTTVPAASRAMADAIPGAELVTLTPARHMGLIERHAEFAGQVARFCRQVTAVRAGSLDQPLPRLPSSPEAVPD